MAEEKPKNTTNTMLDQGKNLIEQGNARHVVVRTPEGKKLIDVSLTAAVIVVLVFLFLMPGWGWALIFFGVVAAIAAKLKIEVVRELNQDDNVVDVSKNDEQS